MDYNIIKIVNNKRKKILNILFIIFILVSIILSFVLSYSLGQYKMTKSNFTDNDYAKIVEVSMARSSNNENRSLEKKDIEKIQKIMEDSAYKVDIYPSYAINFGISANDGNVYYLKSFSDNLFKDNSIDITNSAITKSNSSLKNIRLDIPIVKEKDGNYSSDKLFQKDFKLISIDSNSILSKYFSGNELLISQEDFQKISEKMSKNYKDQDLKKILVKTSDISNVRKVAKLLNDQGYEETDAFMYYKDLDSSIPFTLKISKLVIVILFIFTLIVLPLIYEISLKSSVGDIAVLKHMGFCQKQIEKIYMDPLIKGIGISYIIVIVINFILYKFGIIKGFTDFLNIIISIGILAILLIIIIHLRLKEYSKENILNLMKKLKIQE